MNARNICCGSVTRKVVFLPNYICWLTLKWNVHRHHRCCSCIGVIKKLQRYQQCANACQPRANVNNIMAICYFWSIARNWLVVVGGGGVFFFYFLTCSGEAVGCHYHNHVSIWICPCVGPGPIIIPAGGGCTAVMRRWQHRPLQVRTSVRLGLQQTSSNHQMHLDSIKFNGLNFKTDASLMNICVVVPPS